MTNYNKLHKLKEILTKYLSKHDDNVEKVFKLDGSEIRASWNSDIKHISISIREKQNGSWLTLRSDKDFFVLKMLQVKIYEWVKLFN